MISQSLVKDTLRDIKKSLGRFMSIMLIVMLGVAFFVGIKASPLVMKESARQYYQEQNFMDLQIYSTVGFNDEDIAALGQIPKLEGVMPAYSMDVLSTIDADEMVLKLQSYDFEDLEDKDRINQLYLVEGRLPEKSGEMVLEQSPLFETVKIGDRLELNSGTDESLAEHLEPIAFEVVGFVLSPYYLAIEKGSTTIGNGIIDGFAFISEADFNLPFYTEVFATIAEAKELDTYSDEYFDYVEEIVSQIEALGVVRSEERHEELMAVLPEPLAVELEVPEWYVLDRSSQYSFVDFQNTAESLNMLADIFPLFFVMVAALVCSTTITRMVDEQRINIGTLKALGYKKAAISFKFVTYALLASLMGSSIGIGIGFILFPTVIFEAYAMMYTLPEKILVFDLGLTLVATIVTVLIAIATASLAVNREVKEVAATLMRPRSPKEGKRILFERIPFIWNRLSFIGKVTVRNIFRYKKRFFMTVLGISGCGALLVTGFGIRDSIKTIADVQFNEIFHYDAQVTTAGGGSPELLAKLDETLEDMEEVGQFIRFNIENGEVRKEEETRAVPLMIPETLTNLEAFFVFRQRQSQERISLHDEGVLITEQLAGQLDINIGDEIELTNGNEETAVAVVSDIIENYTFNYLYLTPNYYEQLFDEQGVFSHLFLKFEDQTVLDESALATMIMEEDIVTGINLTSSTRSTFDGMVTNLTYVVLLMIVSAGALAFVVLYNLTNVNISERMREIATIKVLGFYDREVSSYIYRENIMLTVIGIVVGSGLGSLLHRFIMVTFEVENMMFGRSIALSSYVISASLTLGFSILVNAVMYYKLQKIQMVESLKSVD